jgi:hypothetical protein
VSMGNATTPFFGKLFDLTFTKFVTPSLVQLIYGLGMALILLVWLVALIASLTQGFMAFLGMLVIGTIVAFLYLLMLRVWMELIIILFRLGDTTQQIATALTGNAPPTGGFPVMPVGPSAGTPPVPQT